MATDPQLMTSLGDALASLRPIKTQFQALAKLEDVIQGALTAEQAIGGLERQKTQVGQDLTCLKETYSREKESFEKDAAARREALKAELQQKRDAELTQIATEAQAALAKVKPTHDQLADLVNVVKEAQEKRAKIEQDSMSRLGELNGQYVRARVQTERALTELNTTLEAAKSAHAAQISDMEQERAQATDTLTALKNELAALKGRMAELVG